jgi:hypothetical protein
VPFRRKCGKSGRAEQAADGKMIRRMRIACWITKATDTHSEYVINTAFPRQKSFRERVYMLRLYLHNVSYILTTGIL